MKKITLLICLMLCGLFVVGGATASAAGKKPMVLSIVLRKFLQTS